MVMWLAEEAHAAALAASMALCQEHRPVPVITMAIFETPSMLVFHSEST